MHSPEPDLDSAWRIGQWLVHPRSGVIESAGEQRILERQGMDVLLYLARRQGKVVRGEQLAEDLWQEAVADEALPQLIALLRSSLGDNPRSPVYIQTVPKVGYRLIANAERVTNAAGMATGAATLARRRRRALGLGVLLLGAAALIWALALWQDDLAMSRRIPGTHRQLDDWFDALLFGDRSPAEITTVAVLPFADRSEEVDLDYLGDGITDHLIHALGKVEGLQVVARRSGAALRDDVQEVRSIGRHLHVDAILDGNVKHQDGRFHIRARLIGADDGELLWSETGEVPTAEVFGLETRFITAIAHALNREWGNEQGNPPQADGRHDIVAWEFFLNGRHLEKQRSAQTLREAIGLFGKALAQEPGLERARIALARATALLPHYAEQESESAGYARALATLDDMALRDDDERSEAESLRGFIADRSWRWEDAERHHRNALRLNPQNADAYAWYSLHLALVGRLQDSLQAAKRGKDLDTVSAAVNNRLAVAYLLAGDSVRAAEYFAISAELGFIHRMHPGYFAFLKREGRWEESERLMTRTHRREGRDTGWITPVYAYFNGTGARSAAVAACREALEKGDMMPRISFGLWLLLDEPGEAYAMADRLRADRRSLDIEFMYAAEAAAFRADSRYRAFTESLGLDAYWRRFGPPDVADN